MDEVDVDLFTSPPVEEETNLDEKDRTTIVYATVGRSQYAFDIYSRKSAPEQDQEVNHATEIRLTDGVSVNFNGAFAG